MNTDDTCHREHEHVNDPNDARRRLSIALGPVLFNPSNYPEAVRPHLHVPDLLPLREKLEAAVLAEFPALGRDIAGEIEAEADGEAVQIMLGLICDRLESVEARLAALTSAQGAGQPGFRMSDGRIHALRRGDDVMAIYKTLVAMGLDPIPVRITDEVLEDD